MLSRWLRPYPGETIYSQLCRLRKLLGTQRPRRFEKLLGKYSHDVDLNFPVSLKLIEKKTDRSWFRAETAIKENTILPYYRPFNPDALYTTWCNGAITGQPIFRAMGLVRMPHALKACPLCIADDIKAVGEPYYHRNHQVAGVEACYIHGVRLESQIVKWADKLPYAPLADQKGVFDLTPRPAHPVWVTLARDLEDSLRVFPSHGCANFRSFVSSRTLRLGIKTKDWPRLVADYLKEAAAEVPLRLIARLSWNEIASIGSLRTVFPPRYLILIRACGLTPEEVVNFRPSPPKVKKWKCLNRLCGHYSEKVMELEKSFTVSRGSKFPTRRHFLILKCPHCGRTVVQEGDRDFTRNLTAHILDFGPAWNEKFRRLWLNSKVTYREILLQLGLLSNSIAPHHGAFLNGLPLDRTGVSHEPPPRLREYLAKRRLPLLQRALKELTLVHPTEGR